MSLIYEVSISEDPVIVTEDISREPNRLDVTVSDAAGVVDRIENPGAIWITSITPGRARSGEVITISGGGFNPTASRNVVSFSYQDVAPATATETQLTVTTQSSMDYNTDTFFEVKVTNSATGRYATRKIWSQKPLATVLTSQPRSAYPGKSEAAFIDNAQRAEAMDWANLIDLVRFMQGDVEIGSKAGIKSHDGTGASALASRAALSANVSAGFYGQSLVTDASSSSLISYGYAQDQTIAYGGVLQASDTSATSLAVSGEHTTTIGSSATAAYEYGVLGSGKVDLVWLLISRVSGGDTLDRVRVLIVEPPVTTATVIYDSGSGVGLPAGSGAARSVFSASMNTSVSRPSRLKIEVTKSGTVSSMSFAGGLRMFID